MEEKERYVIVGDIVAKDRKNDNCFGIVHAVNELNYQDREINRLTKMLYTTTKHADKLNEQIKAKEKEANTYAKEIVFLDKEIKQLKERLSLKMEELHIAYCSIENVKTKNGNLKEEIKQLKQAQKQLAIEELEKALVLIQNAVNLESPEYDLVSLYDAIVDQIKSLKGEE